MGDIVKNWTQWLTSSRFSYMNEVQKEQTLRWLFAVRDNILDRANLKPGDTLIDIGTGTGLLGFGAYERLAGVGKIILSDAFIDCVEECRKVAGQCGIADKLEFLQSDAANIKLPDNSVDVVVMRSVLVHIVDKATPVKEFYRILKENGRISIFEPIIRKNTKYYELVDPATFPDYEEIKEVEDQVTSDETDSLLNFDEETLRQNFIDAGFKNIDVKVSIETSSYPVHAEMVEPWFSTPPSPDRPNLRQRFEKFMPEDEVQKFIDDLREHLTGKTITINSPVVYISAEK